MQRQKQFGGDGYDGAVATKKKTIKPPTLDGLDELIDELTEEEELTKAQEKMLKDVLKNGYWTGCGCGGATYFNSRDEAIEFLRDKNWK